jgi:hypothetical protein
MPGQTTDSESGTDSVEHIFTSHKDLDDSKASSGAPGLASGTPILTLALASLLLGCSGISGLSEAQPNAKNFFQTEDSIYRLGEVAVGDTVALQAAIPFVLTNHVVETLYIRHCRRQTRLTLEMLQPDGWMAVWSPDVRMCASPPILIAPGERYADTVRIIGFYPSSRAGPQFRTEQLSGVYRIVWHSIYADTATIGAWPRPHPIPLRQRMSNRFTLIAP